MVRAASPFQRVLVIQALRPDRLVSALNDFVCAVIGISSITPPPVSLRNLTDEADNKTPILLITTTGADPSKELFDFAAESIGREHYVEIAMGGGQQELALRKLRQAATDGDWICLKNLHLVVAWLPELEKALAALNPDPKFRLWLTAEPHNDFPTILLQSSIKVTFESPPGIKKNLMRTYEAWKGDFLEKGEVVRAQLLFLLAWFHAVVQERRTYIPQGWTKAYEFSFADLRAGANVIDALGGGSDGKPIRWNFVYGLMENAIYGGRVDNVFDGRVLMTYLRKYFNDGMYGRDMGYGLWGYGGMGLVYTDVKPFAMKYGVYPHNLTSCAVCRLYCCLSIRCPPQWGVSGARGRVANAAFQQARRVCTAHRSHPGLRRPCRVRPARQHRPQRTTCHFHEGDWSIEVPAGCLRRHRRLQPRTLARTAWPHHRALDPTHLRRKGRRQCGAGRERGADCGPERRRGLGGPCAAICGDGVRHGGPDCGEGGPRHACTCRALNRPQAGMACKRYLTQISRVRMCMYALSHRP